MLDLWTYTGALYFCFTIGTTVGYGDTAPSTMNGRLLFIFYVVPGICVCGAMIGEIGILIYDALQRGKVFLAYCQQLLAACCIRHVSSPINLFNTSVCIS